MPELATACDETILDHDQVMRRLRSGEVTIATALTDDAYSDELALDVIGQLMIGAHMTDPAESALALARFAGVRHGDLIGELDDGALGALAHWAPPAAQAA